VAIFAAATVVAFPDRQLIYLGLGFGASAALSAIVAIACRKAYAASLKRSEF